MGKNIGLPDSLLSRFDLLFVMLDERDPENDRKIAERVILNHRHQASEAQLSQFNYFNDEVVIEPLHGQTEKEGAKSSQVYEKAP